MTSKESCPVWGGVVGKVPDGQLAGHLLYCYPALFRNWLCLWCPFGVESDFAGPQSCDGRALGGYTKDPAHWNGSQPGFYLLLREAY